MLTIKTKLSKRAAQTRKGKDKFIDHDKLKFMVRFLSCTREKKIPLTLHHSAEIFPRLSQQPSFPFCGLSDVAVDVKNEKYMLSWLNCRIPCHSKTHPESVPTRLRSCTASTTGHPQ